MAILLGTPPGRRQVSAAAGTKHRLIPRLTQGTRRTRRKPCAEAVDRENRLTWDSVLQVGQQWME